MLQHLQYRLTNLTFKFPPSNLYPKIAQMFKELNEKRKSSSQQEQNSQQIFTLNQSDRKDLQSSERSNHDQLFNFGSGQKTEKQQQSHQSLNQSQQQANYVETTEQKAEHQEIKEKEKHYQDSSLPDLTEEQKENQREVKDSKAPMQIDLVYLANNPYLFGHLVQLLNFRAANDPKCQKVFQRFAQTSKKYRDLAVEELYESLKSKQSNEDVIEVIKLNLDMERVIENKTAQQRMVLQELEKQSEAGRLMRKKKQFALLNTESIRNQSSLTDRSIEKELQQLSAKSVQQISDLCQQIKNQTHAAQQNIRANESLVDSLSQQLKGQTEELLTKIEGEGNISDLKAKLSQQLDRLKAAKKEQERKKTQSYAQNIKADNVRCLMEAKKKAHKRLCTRKQVLEQEKANWDSNTLKQNSVNDLMSKAEISRVLQRQNEHKLQSLNKGRHLDRNIQGTRVLITKQRPYKKSWENVTSLWLIGLLVLLLLKIFN